MTDDKAIQAALDASDEFVDGSYHKAGKPSSWRIHRNDGGDNSLSWPIVAEFTNREERDAALKAMSMRAALAAADKARAEALCEDCPPEGYPTDKTRCDPCPRRVKPYDEAEAARIDEALAICFSDLSQFETRSDAVWNIARSYEAIIEALDIGDTDDNPVTKINEMVAYIANLRAGLAAGATDRAALGKALGESTEELKCCAEKMMEATDFIAGLRGERAALVEALKPFRGFWADGELKGLPDSHLFEMVWAPDADRINEETGKPYPAITAGQLRRTAALVRKGE